MPNEPVLQTQALAETRPGDLHTDEQQAVQSIAASLDPLDSVATITFGKEAMERITAFSDRVLDNIRSRDTGEAGDILDAMIGQMKGCELDRIRPDSFLSRLPLIGELFQTFGSFIKGFDSVKDRLDALEGQLRAHEHQLTTDIERLDGLYQENLHLLQQLDVYIAAGKLKLNTLLEQQVPTLQSKAEASGDPVDAQALRDLQQALGRLEKRLANLSAVRLAALQTAPQIRLSQEGNKMLMEDIQDICHNTIPLWKRQFLIAISNYEKEKALQVTRAVKDYTNQQYVRNAQKLQQLEQEIAGNYQRGILDLDSLKEVNRITIDTLNSTLEHYRDGRRQRAAAELEIARAEEELKQALRQTF
ncbi:TelA-like protein [Oceanisphaera marina]|uniref:TelA-like protein n=1 Tax=Oceanisphaera marina TaxID=2017550 RepID=A0ABQ1IC07_9GAMM|nr:toxic anion resistance protein [Oceanisphaera marina]GGB34111.1 TelA-like protein [Oceanisphaera marina]